MNFDSFIGNESTVESLRSAVARRRVANAYLFAGPDAVGKRTLALLLAKFLLCKHPEGQPCDECSSCQRISRLSEDGVYHPDLTLIQPDGAFIKVDQIREELIRKVRMPPSESTYQVFIIDPAQKMHISAANAFLKSLEEAPGKSVFFLVTSNAAALLPTIKSRCQVYHFSRLDRQEMSNRLVEASGMNPQQAELVARLSNGAPGDALHFDYELYQERRAVALDMVRLSLAEGEITSVFSLSATLHKEKEAFPLIFSQVIGLLRDVMVLASTNDSDRLVNIDIEPELTRLARQYTPEAIAGFIDTLAAAQEPLNRNVRIDSVSEHLMIAGRQKFRS